MVLIWPAAAQTEMTAGPAKPCRSEVGGDPRQGTPSSGDLAPRHVAPQNREPKWLHAAHFGLDIPMKRRSVTVH
eukprot:4805483-Pyramimonas_sp.AAC.1